MKHHNADLKQELERFGREVARREVFERRAAELEGENNKLRQNIMVRRKSLREGEGEIRARGRMVVSRTLGHLCNRVQGHLDSIRQPRLTRSLKFCFLDSRNLFWDLLVGLGLSVQTRLYMDNAATHLYC